MSEILSKQRGRPRKIVDDMTEAEPAEEMTEATMVSCEILRGYWPAGAVEGFTFDKNPHLRSLPPGAIVKMPEDEVQRLVDLVPPVAKMITEKAYTIAQAVKQAAKEAK